MKKICTKCKVEKDYESFYRRRNRNNMPYNECKKCFAARVSINIRNKKKKAIEYLGGKCVDCNQVLHPAVYDFHHTDNSKEMDWRKMQKKSFDKIKVELNKCILLYSNCHRLRHTHESKW